MADLSTKNEQVKPYTCIITPNVLTVFRFFVTAGILFLLMQKSMVSQSIAIALFIVAVVTDFLDGYIARKYNLVSNFGKIADPIADKFLFLGLFVTFSRLGLYHFSWIIPILAREVLVTFIRLVLLRKGKVVAAEKLGKYKVGVQVACLCISWFFLLVRLTFCELVDIGY